MQARYVRGVAPCQRHMVEDVGSSFDLPPFHAERLLSCHLCRSTCGGPYVSLAVVQALEQSGQHSMINAHAKDDQLSRMRTGSTCSPIFASVTV